MTPDVPKLGKRRQRGVRHRRRFDNNWTFSVATAFLVGVAVTSLQLQRQHVHVHGFFVAPPTQIAINAHRSVKTRTIRPKWNRERTNTASAVSLFSTSSRKLQLHAGSASGDGDSKVEVEVDAKASNTGGAGVAAENANANSVEYSFYDEVTIFVRAGSGGQGASTYRKGVGGQNGPPDGGNGGNGGNVVLMVDDSLNTLAGLSPIAYKVNSFGGSGAAVSAQQGRQRPRFKSFRAEIGCDGGRQMKSGRYGKDVVIRVPPGTVVHEIVEDDGYDDDDDDDEDDEYGYDDDEHEDDDREPKETLVELGTLLLPEQGGETNHPAEGSGGDSNAVVTRRMRSDMASSYNHKPTTTLVVARGGEGGEGSGINQKGRGLQRPRLSPQGGEKKKLRLTLKLVADVALVGVPNAGKSTFLSKVTRAKPRIADYPFTTVIPNLGVWVPPELFDTDGRGGGGGTGGNGLVLCDVPGLIEGASRGVGLGHAFLRHVERCHVILHLVDATAEDPVENFRMLNGELIKYGTGQLARMPQVVVINKTDAYDNDNSDGNGNGDNHTKPLLSLEELEAQLKEAMSHSRLMTMSAKEGEGVDDLMVRLSAFVKKVT